MKKYLVICNLAVHDYNEDETFTNCWKVGEYDTVEECADAAYEDTIETIRTSIEGRYNLDDDGDYEAYENEFNKRLDEINYLVGNKEELPLLYPCSLQDLEVSGFDQHEILEYKIIRLF